MTIIQMLAELSERGWSQARIAEKCGATQTTIFRITRGGSTRYEVGKAIELLHKRVIKAKPKARLSDFSGA